ncbi:hypothetical protein D3C87_1266540 [compost metagenome]
MEPVNEEDYALVRQFVVLDKVIPLIGKNQQDIQESSHLFKRLYGAAAYLMQQEAGKEMQSVRLAMNRQKIRILGNETVKDTVCVRFMCRGQEQKMEISRQQMKEEVGSKLGSLMNVLLGRVKET